MNAPYTEIITDNTISCGITLGDGRFHDSRKGYGTFSPDGKSITWDSWRPPTQEEIDEVNARIAWLKSPEGREYMLETEKIIDNLFARHGTSREKMAKTLRDVIEKAPPFREARF